MKNASRISIATLCAAAALGLAGCNSPSSGTAPEVAPVQVQAQDLTPMQKAAGVYAGELPCADCSGIRTTLYLRANGVYTLRSRSPGLRPAGILRRDRGTTTAGTKGAKTTGGATTGTVPAD